MGKFHQNLNNFLNFWWQFFDVENMHKISHQHPKYPVMNWLVKWLKVNCLWRSHYDRVQLMWEKREEIKRLIFFLMRSNEFMSVSLILISILPVTVLSCQLKLLDERHELVESTCKSDPSTWNRLRISNPGHLLSDWKFQCN